MLSCMQVQGTVTAFEITNLPKGTEPRQLVDILDEGGFTDQFDMLLLGRENEDGHTTIINFRWARVWVVISKGAHTIIDFRGPVVFGSGWWTAAMLMAGRVCPASCLVHLASHSRADQLCVLGTQTRQADQLKLRLLYH